MHLALRSSDSDSSSRRRGFLRTKQHLQGNGARPPGTVRLYIYCCSLGGSHAISEAQRIMAVPNIHPRHTATGTYKLQYPLIPISHKSFCPRSFRLAHSPCCRYFLLLFLCLLCLYQPLLHPIATLIVTRLIPPGPSPVPIILVGIV